MNSNAIFRAALLGLVVSFLGCALRARDAASVSEAGRSTKQPKIDFRRDVQPLLAEYCFGCHGEKKKGGLDFRIYRDEISALKDRGVFERVLGKLEAHEMPPENKPQPTAAERGLLTNWVGQRFFQCDCKHPDPGRVTIRRLNRAEYNNTIRELTGVDFQPADDFPADDSGYGFDNIGDVLSLSPALLEKYLAAAEKVLRAAIPDTGATSGKSMSTNASTNSVLGRLLASHSLSAAKFDGARQIITNFATRAFRRPLTASEQQRLMVLFESAQANARDFHDHLSLVLEAVLVSPHFLFRGEVQSEPDNTKAVRPLDDYDLASRLSYFLWSSMPDGELFAQAAHRTLRRNLETEVKRMLKDDRSQALVANFAGQWLQLRNLKLMSPDHKRFPAFNESLRSSMQKETELFFESIWRENRSVLEFIDADYSFLNQKLADLYGIEGVEGDQFRRVTFSGNQRGGLLGQASVLTITSNPTRTSPVKRGKWVLENILGSPPPPPPPNVPELKEGKGALTGSLRQRMEQHRADPNCATCHQRMDPIGFGFENFNAIGAWREKDEEFAVDASGQLVTGETFNGPAELKALIVTRKRDEFVQCLARKMLTYALGRGLEYYDKCAIDEICKALAKDHYKFSTLILEIVKSTPFQMRRGDSAPQGLVAQNVP
jgi:hypothetical protein